MQSLASFRGVKILIFSTHTMSARLSCILGIYINKVRGIRTAEVIKKTLVTCKQRSQSRQKKYKIKLRWSWSNLAKFDNSYDFHNTFSLYTNSFINTCVLVTHWINRPLMRAKVDKQVSWRSRGKKCYQVSRKILDKQVQWKTDQTLKIIWYQRMRI